MLAGLAEACCGGDISQQSLNLTDNRRYRTSLLCLLYFCQGLPWGFATIALLATLSEAGHGKADTATITAMAILPWTFKFFWAPLIDSLRMPSLGIRRPWIVIAQLGMALTLFGTWSSGALGSEATLIYLGWVLFFHNCFASLQDVAVDALAVDLLDEQERGSVIGFMWASKLVGISAGGAGLAIVISRTSLEVAIGVQALVIFAVCMLVIAARERNGERLFPWTAGSAQKVFAAQQSGLSRTLLNLKLALSTRTTFMLCLIAVTAFICEGLYDPLTTEFFVQKLSWSAERFATTQGTWGVAGELIGALGGGYLATRYGGKTVALFGICFVITTLLTFSLTSSSWESPGYPHYLLLPAFRGGIAFTTVCLFSIYMKYCWTAAAATQFTLYMALNNIGYSIGAKLNSWVPAWGVALSYEQYYLLGAVLPVAALLLLLSLDTTAEVSVTELEPQVV
jgi:PAT family beta-lactamase induction signal transducer AmpG